MTAMLTLIIMIIHMDDNTHNSTHDNYDDDNDTKSFLITLNTFSQIRRNYQISSHFPWSFPYLVSRRVTT